MVSFETVRRALGARRASEITEGVSSRAAVALILREGDDGLELLFIQRADHPGDPWSGQMGFPGGRQEARDPSLAATAIRETAEEIGVDLDRSGERMGQLDELRAVARFQPLSLVISPFVFRLAGEASFRLNQEVREIHWLPLDGLLGPAWRSTYHHVHEGRTHPLPCFRHEGRVIWGLTYRMFASLEERLRQADGYGEGTLDARPGS